MTPENGEGGGGDGGVMLKKGPWTAAEDGILIEYVRQNGEGNWNSVQKKSGLPRCGKSCRLRWANHLKPNLKKGAFTLEEERLIVELHAKLGNKWARMASQIHGILNAVSWGILFPIGAIIARYVRTFESADPAWFYLHASCQLSGYAIGVTGWATGLKLGSESKGIQFTTHRNIGITLFTLATVQIFALFLRPKKDHKFRFYWNIYHHGVGYAILILGIINVFKGLDILLPEEKWKSAYIIVIAVLGGIALLLEAVTWIVVLRRKSNKSTKPLDGYNNGEGRQQPLAI